MYIIIAYRWGSKQSHSYIVGIAECKDLAEFIAIDHKYYRGGKYECEVTLIPPLQKIDTIEGDIILYQRNEKDTEKLVWSYKHSPEYTKKRFKVLNKDDFTKEIYEANEYWYLYSDDAIEFIKEEWYKTARQNMDSEAHN